MNDRRTVCDYEEGLRAWRAATGHCREVAVVANPSYVASPCELYPLANRNPGPFDAVVGIVMDMDGTTTTTEPLCLHSLEWMVRRKCSLIGRGWIRETSVATDRH